MSQQIEHAGIITRIENGIIQVQIVQQSACSACHAKGACTASDMDEKIVEIETTDNSFKVGDSVIIFGQQSMGLFAILLAFVIPFLLILTTLFVLRNSISNDAIAGAVAIGMLAPYYIIIYSFESKIKTKFKFEIKNIDKAHS